MKVKRQYWAFRQWRLEGEGYSKHEGEDDGKCEGEDGGKHEGEGDYTQVDQNGIVYDPKTGRKCGKNGVFTTVYSVNTVRFRSVIDRIIWRRNTHRIANWIIHLFIQIQD